MTSDPKLTVQGCVEHLTVGFSERIDFRDEFGTFKRVQRRFPSLLSQLLDKSVEALASRPGGPSGPNKSGSRPPTNDTYTDLAETIHERVARLWDDWTTEKQPRDTVTLLVQLVDVVRAADIEHGGTNASVMHAGNILRSCVRDARIILGFESRRIKLGETSCHKCGGQLSVAQDASTNVECDDCGNQYDRLRWIDLL